MHTRTPERPQRNPAQEEGKQPHKGQKSPGSHNAPQPEQHKIVQVPFGQMQSRFFTMVLLLMEMLLKTKQLMGRMLVPGGDGGPPLTW